MRTCQGYVDPKFSSDMMLLDSDSTDQGAIPVGTSSVAQLVALPPWEVLEPRMLDPTEACGACGARLGDAVQLSH